VKYPFPAWVKFGALLVLALVIVSLGMSGERFTQALHFARAEKMVRAGHWEEAYQAYQEVIEQNTNDTEMMITYAEAAVRSGHPEDSARTLQSLVGRQVTNEQMSRAKAVGVELERRARVQSQLNSMSLPILELR
jgi:thioredoxin-like negative regulator of GroEL